jgi:hypothetical protein
MGRDFRLGEASADYGPTGSTPGTPVSTVWYITDIIFPDFREF